MFDLINNEYYLLIAAGDVNANNIIQKHSLTDKTGSAIDLASYGPVARSAELMMKLHGVFMVLAWLLCSNLGVFVARYFKPQFQNKKLLGKAVWFALHQSAMYTTLILSVLGMTLIII